MSLAFIVPVHGREKLTRVCLRQLVRTCEALAQGGLEANAVVIGEGENLRLAEELGFATVESDNAQLGRKWNDGYQLAADPECNSSPVDFCVPLGSDDWVDYRIFLDRLPGNEEILCFKQGAFVREDGRKLAPVKIRYKGGLGVRVIPRALLERAKYRPAEDHRRRALDASTLAGLTGGRRTKITYGDQHQMQIVDWKSNEQLNSYRACLAHSLGQQMNDPFALLSEHYPAEALAEMAEVYGCRP